MKSRKPDRAVGQAMTEYLLITLAMVVTLWLLSGGRDLGEVIESNSGAHYQDYLDVIGRPIP